jgi:hypothetical protein
MPSPDLVLPGHPFDPDVPNSPQLDEAQWHALLDRGIREMERLTMRYETDGEDFLDGNPKEVEKGLYYFGDQGGHPVFALITASHQFLFDAPGDDSFADIVAERLQAIGIDSPKVTAVLLTSADPDATGGLASVVERWKCAIVAPAEEHEKIRQQCPAANELMSAADMKSQDWFPMEVLQLHVPSAALAYMFSCDGKSVLVCGKIPITITDSNVHQLANALKQDADSPGHFEAGLRRLREVHPNVWLTTKPKYGQNANVYGSEWIDAIDANLDLVRDLRSRPSGNP